MEKYVDLDCELYCDERVLKNCTVQQKQEYALTIVNSMKRGINFSNKFVTGLNKQSDIRKRVMNMFSEKHKNGILMALIISLFSSITFFKFDSTSLIEENDFLERSRYAFEGRQEDMFVTIDSTYADAPIKLRKEHEENCRVNGIVPKDSDSIEIIPRFYKDCMDLKK